MPIIEIWAKMEHSLKSPTCLRALFVISRAWPLLLQKVSEYSRLYIYILSTLIFLNIQMRTDYSVSVFFPLNAVYGWFYISTSKSHFFIAAVTSLLI